MSGVYRLVYRDIYKHVGTDAAVLLAEFVAYEDFCIKKGLISSEGYFVMTGSQIEEFTGFDRYKQDRLIKTLEKGGYISKLNDNGRGRSFKILARDHVPNLCENAQGDPCENAQGTRANLPGVMCENAQGTLCKNSQGLYIVNTTVNKDVISCCEKEEQQQQDLNDQIYAFFKSKIKDEEKALAEAWAFVSYNRENFGADHLTFKNYKRHAEEWIKNMGKGKKRSTKSERGTKTAAEVAEAQGITVDELFIKPMPVNPIGVMKAIVEDYDSGVDNIIREVFGGAE